MRPQVELVFVHFSGAASTIFHGTFCLYVDFVSRFYQLVFVQAHEYI